MEYRKEAAPMMVRDGAVLMRGGGRKEGGKRMRGGGELIAVRSRRIHQQGRCRELGRAVERAVFGRTWLVVEIYSAAPATWPSSVVRARPSLVSDL
jgi:hypothetical protein